MASAETTNTVNENREDRVEKEPKSNVAARVVWYLAGLLLTLLALRFVFALLGANPGNAIANFVYDVTYPFVTPFFGLFNYDVEAAGQGRFEVYTLVAVVIYALITWTVARALKLGRRETRE